MSRTFFLLTILCFIASGCASPPRKEFEAARNAVDKAYASGAQELSPGKYQTALEVLKNAEELMSRGQYRLAKETFPYAEALAQQAIHAAREEQARRDAEELSKKEKLETLKKQLEHEEKKLAQKPTQPRAKTKPETSARPISPKPAPQLPSPASPQPLTRYTVSNGETLWTIAALKNVYQDAFLWPLIYRANRDQIKDPRQIYPGQELNIPRNLKEADFNEARATASKSDIFPLDLLMKASPENEN